MPINNTYKQLFIRIHKGEGKDKREDRRDSEGTYFPPSAAGERAAYIVVGALWNCFGSNVVLDQPPQCLELSQFLL